YTQDLMVVLVAFYEDLELVHTLIEGLKSNFPEITTFIYSINDTPSPTAYGRIEHVLLGPGTIRDSIGEFSFTIHPKAFFQTNTQQAEALYNVALEFAQVQADDIVYDLYCGVGTLSLYLSKVATKVVGIELVEEAIENAKKNAVENNVEHAFFVKGDMKDTFNETLISEYGVPTVLITDPPRAGMHPDVVQQLLDLKTPRIVYVSCDSSTMARDIEKLSNIYQVEAIQPVDMFPQTYHIETVALLTLK
ncbi:MAG: 23S rRNA (uracil(1939)-C(5))-methyltransferase RlmD, partial [Bacteroidota bacterium]